MCWRRTIIGLLLVSSTTLGEDQLSGRAGGGAGRVARLPSLDSNRQARRPQPSLTGELETLEQAWATAVRVADRLAAADLQQGAAGSNRAAAEALRWPTLGLDASYRLRSNESAFVFPVPGELVPRTFPYAQSEFLSFRSVVDLPLYTSGRISSRIDAAKAAEQAAQADTDAARSDLLLAVAVEYCDVLRSESDQQAAQSNVRSLETHLHDVAARLNHAQATRYDLLSAEVSLASARQAALQTANRLDITRAAYNRRLARSLSSDVRLAGLPIDGSTVELERATELALGKRRELDRLNAEVATLRDEAEALLAQNRLQVGLSGEFAYRENQFESPQGIASVALGASWNAFDAGATQHRAEALLQQAAARVRLRADLESAISVEVRQAWLDVHEARQRVQVTQSAIERAQESLRLAQRRYATGVGTASDVLDAESLRLESVRNYSNARHDCGLALVRLRRATGQL